VIAAAKAQCDNIIHSQVNIGYHDKMLELTDTLMPLLPQNLDTIFYGTTGAEAVENSIKMARAYTGKHGVVVFRGGYHGRTFGTMAMTVSGFCCIIGLMSDYCFIDKYYHQHVCDLMEIIVIYLLL